MENVPPADFLVSTIVLSKSERKKVAAFAAGAATVPAKTKPSAAEVETRPTHVFFNNAPAPNIEMTSSLINAFARLD